METAVGGGAARGGGGHGSGWMGSRRHFLAACPLSDAPAPLFSGTPALPGLLLRCGAAARLPPATPRPAAAPRLGLGHGCIPVRSLTRLRTRPRLTETEEKHLAFKRGAAHGRHSPTSPAAGTCGAGPALLPTCDVFQNLALQFVVYTQCMQAATNRGCNRCRVRLQPTSAARPATTACPWCAALRPCIHVSHRGRYG